MTLIKKYSGFCGRLERTIDRLNTQYKGASARLEKDDDRFWSMETRCSRNGRIWPVDRKVVITRDGTDILTLHVTVVTDEGGWVAGYDLNGRRVKFAELKQRIQEGLEQPA